MPIVFNMRIVAWMCITKYNIYHFLERSYSRRELSDKLHPSNLWWIEMNCCDVKLNVSGLDELRHGNLGMGKFKRMFIISVGT